MLIKESVLHPEIFQILSASQAKNKHRKKTQDNIRLNYVCNDIYMYCHTHLHITKFR